ncbi:MAG: hypothetical protein J6O61_16320 [Butyrivibrio sp.]|uniref:hypothetical protein n=1 Tax=Butyrivibrio sp. TaxID=28121 RepID=UPI001B25E54E|nr:hypothetical protein [Butyrivibrio sp.]MBO6242369.1 hypothetical protein [Butyrivibrio sp.]
MRIQQNMGMQQALCTSSYAVRKKDVSSPLSKFTDKITEDDKPAISQQMRQMIRDLKQEQYKNAESKNQTDGFSKLSGTPDAAEEEEIVNSEKYNYKKVATKIRQAKTSISAGQAVLAAKRETLKLKRKIASGSGDAKELQIALTHAKRMEMVARKKKHHLELEELVENTQKRDEKLDGQKSALVQMQSAVVSAEEEKITEKEDAIFDAREEMLNQALEQMQEGSVSFSEEELRNLNEMIAEFGEEQLKELEEVMEMMETMEVVDPHMSKEDLEELKRKHRASEDKAIMKANMEYLKDMIKHELSKNASMPGMGSTGASLTASFSMPQGMGAGAGIPALQASVPSIDVGTGAGASSIDIQV